MAPEAVGRAVAKAVGGGCQSGWGELLLVTNAIEAVKNVAHVLKKIIMSCNFSFTGKSCIFFLR